MESLLSEILDPYLSSDIMDNVYELYKKEHQKKFARVLGRIRYNGFFIKEYYDMKYDCLSLKYGIIGCLQIENEFVFSEHDDVISEMNKINMFKKLSGYNDMDKIRTFIKINHITKYIEYAYANLGYPTHRIVRGSYKTMDGGRVVLKSKFFFD